MNHNHPPLAWQAHRGNANDGHRFCYSGGDPYVKIPDLDAGLKALHLPPALRAAVDRENALPLFPRFDRKA